MNVLQSKKWLRAEMLTLAAFHFGLGLVFGFAPASQVVTPTSISAFRVMPDVLSIGGARVMWAIAFILCATFLALLTWRPRLWMQFIAWGSVLWVDGTWLAAYALPIFVGRGSAIGSVVFPALIAWSVFVLIRVAQSNGG